MTARFAFWAITGVALAWFWISAWHLVGQPIAAHVLSLFAALST